MLSFYWQVKLKDNSIIIQSTPSNFGVVQKEDAERNIVSLHLMCEQDGIAHISINLVTGTFIVRGAEFHPYISLIRAPDVHYRIIFYRRNRKLSDQDYVFTHKFLLGWQCTIGERNYQRIIFYNPFTGGIEIKGKR